MAPGLGPIGTSPPSGRGATRRSRRLLAGLGLLTAALVGGCWAGGTVSPRASTAAARPTANPTASPTRPASPEASAACSNTQILTTWTVRRLAEQTLVVPVQADAVATVTPEVAAGAGGVILFGTSAPSNLQLVLARLTATAPGSIAPLVMVDEEGGSVQRIANLVGSVPSARQMGATMTAAQIGQVAERLGRQLRLAGITADLSPVLDADAGQGPSLQDPIGSRSFSADPTVARDDGLAFAEGLLAAGVLPVVKHFPGLGGAFGNSDLGRAVTQPWSRLQRTGLIPFQAAVLAHLPAVMVTNASVPGLTDLPASISAAVVTGLLRGRLGFQGLIMTDSLSAVALSSRGYSVARASAAAVEVGADLVLFNATAGTVAQLTNQTVSAIVAAVAQGRLGRSRLVDAVAHVLTAKQVDLCSG